MKWLRRTRPLAKRMKDVDWAIQRIDADAGSLGVLRLGYTGDLPAPPAPFEWIWPSPHDLVGSSPRPGLNGEKLSYQHLTPEQMATCLAHEDALQAWARATRVLRERVESEQAARRRAQWDAQADAQAARRARFAADVEERLREYDRETRGA